MKCETQPEICERLESRLQEYNPQYNQEIEKLLGLAKYQLKRIEYESYFDRYKEIKRIR